MDRQPDRDAPQPDEEAKEAKRIASLGFVLDDQKMKGLLEGPAGWLWRAEWVAEGLAKRRPDDEDSANPFHQRKPPGQ